MQTSGVFSALSDQVEKLIVDFARQGLNELDPVHEKILKTVSITSKFKRMQSIAPLGAVPAKAEGEEYSFDVIQPGYSKDFTPREYGLAFQVTQTAQEDDEYDVIGQKSKWLGFSMRVLQETNGAAVLNNGFTATTGTLTADGLSLFNTAHTLKRGGTAKNRPSVEADLSTGAIDQIRSDMRTNTKLESGQLVRCAREFYLVHHPDNEGLAYRICRSNGLQGTANNDVNHLNDGIVTLTPLPWEYLTDADAWFLIAKNSSQHGLVRIDRIKPTLSSNQTDPKTGNVIVSIRMRQVCDAFDWRNVAGTSGA